MRRRTILVTLLLLALLALLLAISTSRNAQVQFLVDQQVVQTVSSQSPLLAQSQSLLPPQALPSPPPASSSTLPASGRVRLPSGAPSDHHITTGSGSSLDANCPPHLAGPRCEMHAFAMCVQLWGFNLTLAPCFETRRHPTLPVSCECLADCDTSVAAARVDCVHGLSTLMIGAGGFKQFAPKARLVNLSAYSAPWQGHPKDLSKIWPELRIRYDPGLVSRLQEAGRLSRAAGRCGGRGIHRQYAAGAPDLLKVLELAKFSQHECSCVPGYVGKDCVPITWHASSCFNGCSGAGRCIAGTCVCDAAAAARGIDCSDTPSSMRESSSRLRLALNLHANSPSYIHQPSGGTGAGLGAGHGFAESILGNSSLSGIAEEPYDAVSPRIYVYELPAPYTSWLALPHVRATGCGDRSGDRSGACWWQEADPAYGADVQLLRRLLRSPHRTHDAEKADFFYVPLMLSLGFMTHRFGIYLPSSTSAQLIDAVVAHIKFTMPYWNRTNGSDHLMAFTGDDGSTWLRGRLPQLEHTMFVTHWGALCNDRNLRSLQRAGFHSKCVQQLGFRPHRSGHDLVVPPLHKAHELLPTSLWLSQPLLSEAPYRAAVGEAAAAGTPASEAAALTARLSGTRSYRYLLYFVGKVNRSAREGDIYSGGVRQRVFSHHAHRTDFYLRSTNQGQNQDASAMANSKFCLAPYGTGFGMREFDALMHGCVPLLIRVRWEDDRANGMTVEQPFADIIPWNAFTLRLTRDQIPNLPELLAQVTPQQHAALVRAGACAWPHFFWTPSVPEESASARLASEPPLTWPMVAPSPVRCGPRCREALRQLEPHDAFSTLMRLLDHRLRLRKLAQSATSTTQPAQSLIDATPAEFVVHMKREAALAEAAQEREDEWAKSSQELRRASWVTPVASCLRALDVAETESNESGTSAR
jgi:hypothetical protein